MIPSPSEYLALPRYQRAQLDRFTEFLLWLESIGQISAHGKELLDNARS